VRDHDRRPALHQVRDGLLHDLLGLGVERGGGLVEDQDLRVAQHRARDGDALALAAGELPAELARGVWSLGLR
jgi:hypothetical protein